MSKSLRLTLIFVLPLCILYTTVVLSIYLYKVEHVVRSPAPLQFMHPQSSRLDDLHKPAWQTHREAFQLYSQNAADWSAGILKHAASGVGSKAKNVRPFLSFLHTWIDQHKEIGSIVEASAGHWPSGWQSFMKWPRPVDYIGVDLMPSVINDNNAMLQQQGVQTFGLRSMRFQVLDMLEEVLPAADLLITKDTLIHFPNSAIASFLEQSVLTCPSRFKYVMFVHDSNPSTVAPDGFGDNNDDIAAFGHFHRLNLSQAPFNLPTSTVFTWRSNFYKAVQIFQSRC